jgi:hypothetical protein
MVLVFALIAFTLGAGPIAILFLASFTVANLAYVRLWSRDKSHMTPPYNLRSIIYCPMLQPSSHTRYQAIKKIFKRRIKP